MDEAERVLLFRFEHRSGPLAGTACWATPGGAVEMGETFAEAASRELREETGLAVEVPDVEVARLVFTMSLATGETVEAEERFFLLRTRAFVPARAGLSAGEAEEIAGHRWWPRSALDAAVDRIWPEGLSAILDRVLAAGIEALPKPSSGA